MTVALVPTVAELDRFRGAIRRRLGLQFEDGKLPDLEQVLRRRVDASGRGLAAYLADLDGTERRAAEVGALARELTVGETYFFRHSDQFKALREVVLPTRARARASAGRLRLLSVGCATGEEPYSLSIVARELPELLGLQVSIRGVDVNPGALQRAREARYSAWALRETPAEMREQYFRADGRDLILAPRVQASVSFEVHNLVEASPLSEPGEADVIFCRNVLMYFAPEVAREVVARLARCLAPGGYLFLGYAETLRGLSQAFRLCHTHETFYYQHHSDRGGVVDNASGAPSSGRLGSPAPPSPIGADKMAWAADIERASERIRALTASVAGGATLPPVDAADRPSDREGRPHDLGRAFDLMRQERFQEARSTLEALPPESAGDPDVLLLQAVLLTHGGDLVAAAQLCDRVLALDEMSAGAHYLAALCRAGAGDDSGAINHDQVAIHLDPSFAMPHLHLGLLARRKGDVSIARRELQEALSLLEREDPLRLLLFGGGFTRQGLIGLCRAELAACRGAA